MVEDTDVSVTDCSVGLVDFNPLQYAIVICPNIFFFHLFSAPREVAVSCRLYIHFC